MCWPFWCRASNVRSQKPKTPKSETSIKEKNNKATGNIFVGNGDEIHWEDWNTLSLYHSIKALEPLFALCQMPQEPAQEATEEREQRSFAETHWHKAHTKTFTTRPVSAFISLPSLTSKNHVQWHPSIQVAFCVSRPLLVPLFDLLQNIFPHEMHPIEFQDLSKSD